MTARSCAVDEPDPPGPSRPDGVAAWVLVAPREAALAFILATVTSGPPSMWANVLAASLPETSSRPSRSWRAVYVRPGLTPTQLHSTWVSATSATTVESRLTESRTTWANSVLMVLAGGWATFWSRPAST